MEGSVRPASWSLVESPQSYLFSVQVSLLVSAQDKSCKSTEDLNMMLLKELKKSKFTHRISTSSVKSDLGKQSWLVKIMSLDQVPDKEIDESLWCQNSVTNKCTKTVQICGL